jgi:hypothetical protein
VEYTQHLIAPLGDVIIVELSGVSFTENGCPYGGSITVSEGNLSNWDIGGFFDGIFYVLGQYLAKHPAISKFGTIGVSESTQVFWLPELTFAGLELPIFFKI